MYEQFSRFCNFTNYSAKLQPVFRECSYNVHRMFISCERHGSIPTKTAETEDFEAATSVVGCLPSFS